jgi:hypothetical protein
MEDSTLFEPMTPAGSSNLDTEVVTRLLDLLPQCPAGKGVWLRKLGFDPSAADSSKHVRDSYRGAVIRGLGVDKERVITSTRRLADGSRDIQIGLAR